MKTLQCGCCGGRTRGKQHWNQDKGFGLCASCVYYILEGKHADEIKSYGTAGVNFPMPIIPENVGKIPLGTLVCSRKVGGDIVDGVLADWDNGTAIIKTEEGKECAA